MVNTNILKWVEFPQFGCEVAVSEDEIMTRALFTDGTKGEIVIVTMCDEDFINQVNEVFDTDFLAKDVNRRA